jgi:hypothetical protein
VSLGLCGISVLVTRCEIINILKIMKQMHNLIKKNILLAIIIFIITTNLYTAEKTVFSFLKLNSTANNSALNNSNISYTERNGNILANPALIPLVSRYYLHFNYSTIFSDYEQYYLNYYYPIKYGFLSAGILKNNLPNLIFENQLIPDKNYENRLYYMSYGVNIYEFFRAGTTIKYVEEKENSETNNKLMLDIGFLIEIIEGDANIGIKFENLRNDYEEEGVEKKIPVKQSIGMNYDMIIKEDVILTCLTSFTKINGEKSFLNFGMIFKYHNLSFLTGYSTRDMLNDKLNYGLSYEIGNANISVARTYYGDIGNYTTIDLSFEFGKSHEQKIQSLYRVNTSENIRCLNCGYEYLPEYNYCPKCGQSAATLIY